MVQFWREDLAHEQFVFFYIDVFGFSLQARRPWYRGDQDDQTAREAFQVPTHTQTQTHTLPVSVSEEQGHFLSFEWAEPRVTLLLFAEREDPDLPRTGEPGVPGLPEQPEGRRPAHVQLHHHRLAGETGSRLVRRPGPASPGSAAVICGLQMNIIAGGFYDGVMIYAQALNETMATVGGRPAGGLVRDRMWNRTFHGEFRDRRGTTGEVCVDEEQRPSACWLIQ